MRQFDRLILPARPTTLATSLAKAPSRRGRSQRGAMGRSIRRLFAGFVVALTVTCLPPTVLAEDPPPPAVGITILEDELREPTLIQPFACRSQRAGVDYVGEGLRLKLTGPCNDGEIIAGIGPFIRGLTMLDGEVRLEVKAVSGIDRVRIGIDTRAQPFTPDALKSLTSLPAAHAGGIEPGRGQALLGLVGQPFTRKELGGLVSAEAWNTVALRLQGPNVWLLVNDQPTLFFTDSTVDRGEVFFDIVRVSDGPRPSVTDPNDTTEIAAVFRNLKVSALAEGDPTRMPSYRRP